MVYNLYLSIKIKKFKIFLFIVTLGIVLDLIITIHPIFSSPRQSKILQENPCAENTEVRVFFKKQAKIGFKTIIPAQEHHYLGNLTFTDPEGNSVKLKDYGEKILLLNLWATWCPICRDEIRELDSLQKEKGNKSFEVITINIDLGSDDPSKNYFKNINIQSLRLYRENTLSLFEILKKQGLISGLPSSLLIDKKSCLLGSFSGPVKWANPNARVLINDIITVSDK